MKKFLLFMLLAVTAGVSAAWAVNQKRYGGRPGHFGPFTMDGEFRPSELQAYLTKDQSEGQAKVEMLTPTTHDFGLMKPDQEGEYTFVVKNVGKDDLRLRLGATTCKCTLGELEREALAPGEQTTITLSWTVMGDDPKFSQSAQVITNDPSRVVIQLAISGKIVEQVDMVPENWTFGEVATGETMVVTGTIYNFMDVDIQAGELKFSSEEMTALTEFEVEAYKPSEETDGIRGSARQAFKVTAKIRPGMRQGAVSQNLMFGFTRIDENGEPIENAEANKEDEYIVVATKGRIVGPLGMIPNSKLSGQEGGGYVYNFGKLGKEDRLIAKTFVVLRGGEQENTTLRIGECVPENAVRATLGEARKGKGTMTLYPLEIELIPGDKPIARMGKDSGDYGAVWIESDNPKVAKMRIALKFSIEAQ